MRGANQLNSKKIFNLETRTLLQSPLYTRTFEEHFNGPIARGIIPRVGGHRQTTRSDPLIVPQAEGISRYGFERRDVAAPSK